MKAARKLNNMIIKDIKTIGRQKANREFKMMMNSNRNKDKSTKKDRMSSMKGKNN